MQKPEPSSIPLTPGVYLYKDAKGRIIYVGKARVLRRRVLSYFRPEGLPAKTRAMRATNTTVLNLEPFAQTQQTPPVAEQQRRRQHQIHLRKKVVQAQRVVGKPQQGLQLGVIHAPLLAKDCAALARISQSS